MKKKSFPLFIILVIGLLFQSGLAMVSTTASWNADCSITVGDYTVFLNAAASTDAHGLYHEKINGILRFGGPGYYRYAAVPGEEEKEMAFTDARSAMRYCNWLEYQSDSRSNDPEITEYGTYELQDDQLLGMNAKESHFMDDGSQGDCFIKSSRFNVPMLNASCDSELSKKKSGKNDETAWKKEADIIGLVGVLLSNNNEIGEDIEERRRNEQGERRSSPPENNRRTDSLTDESDDENNESEEEGILTIAFKGVSRKKVMNAAKKHFGNAIEEVKSGSRLQTVFPITSSNQSDPKRNKTTSSSSSSSDASRTPAIFLKQIKEALKNNPTAGRFLIQDQGETSSFEVSRSWNPLRLMRSSQEDKIQNKKVATTLRAALQHEYGSTIINGVSLLMNDTTDWSTSRIDQVIRAADEIAEPTKLLPSGEKMQPTEEDLQQFPGARVIDADEVDGSEAGQKVRRRILKTNFHYPYIRIEETIDSISHSVVDRTKMIADHLLVTLDKEDDVTIFYQKLQSEVSLNQELRVEKSTPYGRCYIIYFKPTPLNLLLQVLAATKKLGVVSEPDFISTHTLLTRYSPSDPLYRRQWNLHARPGIQLLNAWNQQNTSTPVPIAILDTGIYDHEDLRDNLWKDSFLELRDAYSLNDQDRDSRENLHGYDALGTSEGINDTNGHGTHCAGIIGAVHNQCGIAGIVRNAQLMVCKITNNNDILLNKHIRDGIGYICTKNAKVVNCSFGGKFENGKYPPADQNIVKALKDARDEGIIFVVAAGNDGRNNDVLKPYPASYPLDNIVVVAGTTKEGQLIPYSNYGKTTVHLAAPGVDILSTGIQKTSTWGIIRRDDNAYYSSSGTSTAAPHVTGALAFMKAEFPNATYRELINRLLVTTDPIPTLDGDDIAINKETIAGLLNLDHALRKDLAGPFGVLTLSELQSDEENLSKRAIETRDRAHKEAIVAEFLKDKTLAASETEKENLWLKTITEARKAKDHWNETVAAYQRGLQQASDFSRDWWSKEHAAAVAEVAAWEARITDWSAQRNNPSQRCIVM